MGSQQTLTCPNACASPLIAAPLADRNLIFCLCRDCGLLWLDGPEGRAFFTLEEYTELTRLERIFRSGEEND